MGNLNAKEYKRFEDIKRTYDNCTEYWLARELAPILEYTQWRNFTKVMEKAMIACKASGNDVSYHFAEISKMIALPKGAKRDVLDYELSRYACYLIVQNGDPRKEVIALGQTYFAIQTYRQEIADRFNQLDEDSKRLVVRGDIKQWNQLLAEAARNAGVITNEEFAVFQNAGYMGLYGGKREDIHGADEASNAHYKVGHEVRKAIERVGGTMPEDLPTPEKSIAALEKEQLAALKKKGSQLMLDE
jgi:DNA-damage-inducible protein D